ncbi:conserved hypothetical protein [Catenulispora acidiphila DSM 44928]|uniref:DUF4388 domain-containing protein n=1 Tax=Catenulispora acidiphila (strain DSM 44928 / JCM 14897 / NBRC 102108 / NRRL B-24433 / ID139908) TaxID=479433 RepID=C7QGE3_CATAD|nr:hypothetical protein [Catenulispora acidiphila]ACU72988.1 conserved hypothetical protein [Catenulispora acidiphila DSM 44928]
MSQAPRNVPALLVKLLAEDFTGAVEVSGTPGGTIHLRRGLVIAVDTPNAPSVETLLIRSGRIDEDGWAAAITRRATAAATTTATATATDEVSDLNSVLIDLGLIGQGELEAVCIGAVYDAAFAMALNPAEGWTVHDAAVPPELVTCPGESPRGLADETSRRINALTRSWGSLAELAGARCRPAARIDPALLTARQQAVLLAANGRRTARDIAFFLGCGVYPAMLDITRLRARRLLEWEAPRTTAPPSTARRVAPVERPTDEKATALPRRIRRDRSSEDTGGRDSL